MYLRPTNISIISSWFDADLGSHPPPTCLPPSLFVPLREGFRFIDLYFISHAEMPWYYGLVESERAKRSLSGQPPAGPHTLPVNPFVDPIDFIVSLNADDVFGLARNLRRLLHSPKAEPKQGIVTWWPRIVALATYFPRISSVDLTPPRPEKYKFGKNQTRAIGALRRSLLLAHHLGAKVVEIVGGAGVPSTTDIPEKSFTGYAHQYREAHYEALAHALAEAYLPTTDSDILDDDKNVISSDVKLFNDVDYCDLPPVAIELEPGTGFLMSEKCKSFTDLRKKYKKVLENRLPDDPEQVSKLYSKLTLNLDVAHAFMLGLKPDDLTNIPIGHLHISDHAAERGRGGAHASDLVPGKFHSAEEYAPWLDDVIKRAANKDCNDSQAFSGYVAIELEACNQVDRLHAAATTLARWMQKSSDALTSAHASCEFADDVEGFILTIDLGNSSDYSLSQRGENHEDDEKSKLEAGARDLASMIEFLMTRIYRAGGIIVSFGGDGFIAIFETAGYSPKRKAEEAERVLTEITDLCHGWKPKRYEITLRIALHYGVTWLLCSGPLRNQALSQDLVTCVRLCEECKPFVSLEGKSEKHKIVAFAITGQVHDHLTPKSQQLFEKGSPVPLIFRDGKKDKIKVWVHSTLTTNCERNTE